LTQKTGAAHPRAPRNHVGLAIGVPGTPDIIGSLSLATSTVYFFAAAMPLWLGRQEQLAARWPIIVLTAVQALIIRARYHAQKVSRPIVFANKCPACHAGTVTVALGKLKRAPPCHARVTS
jgi:hypothetical protein